MHSQFSLAVPNIIYTPLFRRPILVKEMRYIYIPSAKGFALRLHSRSLYLFRFRDRHHYLILTSRFDVCSEVETLSCNVHEIRVACKVLWVQEAIGSL